MRQDHDVLFRGTREGLLILLNDQMDFDELLERLATKLHASGRFFRGAEVTVAVGRRRLSEAQRASLQRLVQDEHGLMLKEIREGENLSELLTRTLRPAGGLRGPGEQVPAAGSEKLHHVPGGAVARDEAPCVVTRTLRSGQAIRHRGDVIIIGDVNPGAEVVATGHIIVFGALRGVAHAGAGGDETAIVAALKLAPTQLRIGHRVGRPPDEDQGPVEYLPEVARVVDGQIVIESRNRRLDG